MSKVECVKAEPEQNWFRKELTQRMAEQRKQRQIVRDEQFKLAMAEDNLLRALLDDPDAVRTFGLLKPDYRNIRRYLND